MRSVRLSSAGVVLLLLLSACGGNPEPDASKSESKGKSSAESPSSTSDAQGDQGAKPGKRAKRAKSNGPGEKETQRVQQTGAGAKAAPGWKRAFAKDPAGLGCNWSLAKAKASNAPRLVFGNTTVFVGFEQQGNNQDPVFFRFDGNSKTYCEHHEREAPDGRAVGFTWDGGNTAYVAYTVVGGGTEFDNLARNGWENRYGDGGASSKVTVIAKVELAGGEVTDATFLTAKLVDGGQLKTNSITPTAAPMRNIKGNIKIWASSAFAPQNPNHTLMCKPFKEYPSSKPGRKDKANYLGVFTPALRGLKCAQTWGCTRVRKPCKR